MSVDERIELLFKKYDGLLEKFNEHEKWSSNLVGKTDSKIEYLAKENAELKTELRTLARDIMMQAETTVEEINKIRQEALKTENENSKAVEILIKEAQKAANQYTNRALGLISAIITIIGVIVAIIGELNRLGVGR